jgi:signal transduction histidine kinase
MPRPAPVCDDPSLERCNHLTVANVTIAVLALALLVVWFAVPRAPFAGVASYLPFHSFAETFSIVVSMMIFGVMWHGSGSERDGGLIMLSCAMLAAGLLDFGHMLSVSNMPAFVTPSSPDKGIAFWLAARMTAAVGLVLAALRLESPLGMPGSRYTLVGISLGITAVTYWVVLFHLDALPRFFVEGSGLTPFKVASECFITAMLAVPTVLFYRRARRSRSPMHVGLYAAAAVSLLSELYFSIYAARHDLFQVFGHAYKVVAYLFVYRAVFLQNVREPFENLRREISQRKRAEDEVRQANESLERRVHERTSRLEGANKELEAFAYSVSHELRSPLSAMLAAVHLMQRSPGTGEDARGPLEVIRRNVQVSTRLIDDLLAFSRLSQQPLRKELIDQEALVRGVLQSLEAKHQSSQKEISVGDLPPVEADPRFVEHIWLNLIGNAVKYTRGRERPVVRVGAETQDGVSVYFVRDNGVGFDMQDAHKLFTVFQRLHPAEGYEGTGLGLVIVQRIIERHGGRIWAQAAKNQGATFYFTLQAAANGD